MATTQHLFPTLLYRDEIKSALALNYELESAALDLAHADTTGLKWCRKHGYPGYTSYASNLDLAQNFPVFRKLENLINSHAMKFARQLHWDLRGGKPVCDSLWVNVMAEGGSHTSHIHTNSVISGTYYVVVPSGAGPIVYEDPRIAMMMAAPPRKQNAPREFLAHVSETPKAGTLMLWESWLRHEVPLNRAEGNRISVSFNVVIGSK